MKWVSAKVAEVIIENSAILDTSLIHYPTVEEVFNMADMFKPDKIIFMSDDPEINDAIIIAGELHDNSIKDVVDTLSKRPLVLLSNRVEFCSELMEELNKLGSTLEESSYERFANSL